MPSDQRASNHRHAPSQRKMRPVSRPLEAKYQVAGSTANTEHPGRREQGVGVGVTRQARGSEHREHHSADRAGNPGHHRDPLEPER